MQLQMSGGSSPADQSITSRMIDLAADMADVATSQTTTSVSYTDLATVGPAITLSPGVTQTHLLIVSAEQGNLNANSNTHASVAIAGAAAQDVDGFLTRTVTNDSNKTMTRLTLAATVASGSTHTMKYRVESNTLTSLNRRLIGICI